MAANAILRSADDHDNTCVGLPFRQMKHRNKRFPLTGECQSSFTAHLPICRQTP